MNDFPMFQAPQAANMELLVYVHDTIFTYCIGILLFVSVLVGVTLFQYQLVEYEPLVSKKLKRMASMNLRIHHLAVLLKRIYPREAFEKLNYRGYGYYMDMHEIDVGEDYLSEALYSDLHTYDGHFPHEWYNVFEYPLRARSNLWNNHFVEFGWTIVPSLILVAVSVPSFMLLYTMEPTLFYDSGSLFIKVVGHQWYWSYEFSPESYYLVNSKLPVYTQSEFSSYMLPDEALRAGDLRLLSVDKPLFLPVNTNIVVRVTAEDVLHSWAVPAFGIKIDAIPGRVNETSFKILYDGEYFGQCSELCGINHGFMPIHIVSWAPLR